MSLATPLTDQQLQGMSLNLSAGFDLQPQPEFQLSQESLALLPCGSFMGLIQWLLWPSLNSEHKKTAQKGHGVSNMQLLVLVKFQERNKLLLITWSECVPMANSSRSQRKVVRNSQRLVNVSVRLMRGTFLNWFFFPIQRYIAGQD